MESQNRESDKLAAFLKSWPMYTAGGFAMAFLVQVLTDSHMAALYLSLGFFFAALGICINSPMEWKRWACWVVLFGSLGGGVFIWRSKYPPVTPRLIAADINSDGNSKILLGLFNAGGAELPLSAKEQLVIVPFDGNKILEERVSWVSVEKNKYISARELEKFTFDIASTAARTGLNPAGVGINQAVFFVVAVVSDKLPDGFWVDVAGYTSRAGRNMFPFSQENRRTLNDDQEAAILDFSKEVRKKIKGCLDKGDTHLACFSNNPIISSTDQT